MMKSRIKFGALLAVMLIVSMALVPGVLAQPGNITPIANEKSTGGCTECTNNGGCSGGIAGNATELQGKDKDKVLDAALKNSQVKKVQKQLIAEDFVQKDIKVYVVPVQSEDGHVVENQVATIGFESSNAGVANKMLMFAYNPETGGTVVVQGTGWDCVLCTSALVGCGACGLACGTIGPICITCIASVCPVALYQCTVCCCSLGSQGCCDTLEW